MAKVPLRLYNREIENLIDHKQTEEAIAHCRHILQVYPKHIDTYRLLGKAYLETQRYGEATDIFQRVISVIPDDFVSHVGMSIIRENEGNLDASIWHMERAFEVAPANAAVQEELRRLYSRRDGVEPPKVRLTRGALVRMYAKGDLYDQAINEIRSALAEEPDRTDLQVMLARMYLANNQRIEATEICSSLIAKFPFCWAANQILAEILPGTARSDDTQVYEQRLTAMDPYMAFISPIYSVPADVPDTMVLVERLEWDASRSAGPDKPGWAESLGIKIEDTFPADIPDWLNPNPPGETQAIAAGTLPVEEVIPENAPHAELPPAQPAGTLPEIDITSTPSTIPDDMIPDWMKDAGWLSTDMDASTADQASMEEAGESQPDLSDIVPAEIPDWVRSMAPAEALEQAKPVPPPSPKAEPPIPVQIPVQAPQPESLPIDMPEWLNGIIDQPEETPTAYTSAGAPVAVPSWLEELEPESPVEQPAAEISELEAAMGGGQVPPELEVTEVEAVQAGEAVEEAMPVIAGTPLEVEPPVEEFTAVEAFEMPEAVEQPSVEALEVEIPVPAEEVSTPQAEVLPAMPEMEKAEVEEPALAEGPEEVTLPGWMDTYEEEPLEDQPSPVIPVWLEGIQVEGMEPVEEVSAETAGSWFDETAAASDLAQQVQSWTEAGQSRPVSVQQEEIESAAPVVEPTSVEPEVSQPVLEVPEVPAEAEVFGGLEAGAEIAVPSGVEEGVQGPKEEQELPDWLKALHAEEAAEAESIEPALGETMEIKAEEVPAAAFDEAKSEGEQPEAPAAPKSEKDTTLSWLESLATTHASEAQTLIVRRSDRELKPPQWVSDTNIPEPAPDYSSVEPFPAAAAGSTTSEKDALENWLKELEAEQQAKAPDAFIDKREPVPKNTAALRMWLDNLLGETGDLEPSTQPASEYSVSDLIGSDQPEWLHEHIQPPEEAVPESQLVDQTEVMETPSPVEEAPQAAPVFPEQIEPAFEEMKLEEIPTAGEPPEGEGQPVVEAEIPPAEVEAPSVELEAITIEEPTSESGMEIPESPVVEEIPTTTREAEAAIPEERLEPLESVEALAEQAVEPGAEVGPVQVEGEEIEVSLAGWLEEVGEVAPVDTSGADTAELQPLESVPETSEVSAGMETPQAEVEITQPEPEAAELPTAEVSIEELGPVEAEMPAVEIPAGEETLAEAEEVLPVEPAVPAPVEEVESAVEAGLADLKTGKEAIEAIIPGESAEAPTAGLLEEVPEPTAEAPIPEMASPVKEVETTQPEEEAAPAPSLPDWLKNIVEKEEAQPALEAEPAGDIETSFKVQPEEEAEPLFEIPPSTPEGAGEKAGEALEEVLLPTMSTGTLASRRDWELLQIAEKNLWGGEVETSLNQYTRLIKSEQFLEETIRDLKDALYQRPLDISIWETLGDAYARNNCLQDALDAYTKAEELLR